MLFLAVAALAALSTQDVAWSDPPVPTGADYPRMAADLAITGYAIVTCSQTPEGVPINCFSTSSRPANLGFGDAAVRMVQRGRVALAERVDPEATGFSVNVPFNPRERPDIPSSYIGPEPSREQSAAANRYVSARMRRALPLANRIARGWKIERLPANEQADVRSWLEEDALTLAQERELMTLGIGRLLALRELTAVPAMNEEEHRIWLAEARRLIPNPYPSIMNKMRAKYCAAYDCTSGLPPSTSSSEMPSTSEDRPAMSDDR